MAKGKGCQRDGWRGWRNKRGSYTVFIVMAFSAMLLMVYGVITAAGRMAISATTEDFGRIWGTSILAEYDLNLKDRYGIFGFYGEPSMVETKLEEYAGYTFNSKRYISYGRIECDLDGYCLTEPEVLKAQISEAVIFSSKPKGLCRGEEDGGSPAETYGSRAVTSKWILNHLPSKTVSGGADVQSLASAIKSGKVLEELVGTSMVNQYIFTYFHHNQSTLDLGDTYFKNEIEYILCGTADDQKAKKNVRSKLVILRNLLNLAYLYASPEKREIAMTLAAAMTPGPEAVLTQGVLMELWAFAEAENDANLLYDGEPVPLVKQDQNWALTLENAMGSAEGTVEDSSKMGAGQENEEGGDKKNYIRPAVCEGADYEDYLRILVNTVPEKTRLYRIMDLIQINMKYLYCDYFLLADYYTGLRFSMQVAGVNHPFEENYERVGSDDGESEMAREEDIV